MYKTYKREDGFAGMDLHGLNEGASDVLNLVPEVIVKVDLGEIMEQRGVKQLELSEITGIRQATISDMINHRRAVISLPHLIVLMIALKIPRLSDIFEVTFPDDIVKAWEVEGKEWNESDKMPDDRSELMIKSAMRRIKK